MSCPNFHGALSAQKKDLKAAIDEDKWYLSEQEGYDVGDKNAEGHFLTAFINKWAKDWRHDWCSSRCPNRENCEDRHTHYKGLQEDW